jgi:hypothetical protein
MAADLVGSFEGHLQLNVMLAFFIPGIVYLADAVGTQTETVVVRGLSLGIPMRRMVARELLAGILIGVALAARPAVCLVALERPRSSPVSGCFGLRRVLHGDAGGHDAPVAVRRLWVGSGLWERSSRDRHSRSLVHLDLRVGHDSGHVMTTSQRILPKRERVESLSSENPHRRVAAAPVEADSR